ncbi:MAG: spore cortex biosynthesis protein YabQ [Lachnospiraceae bacterium]|nr:spore cortex biosynthesis protein YabQ [Lachnospiraceae bacterium]
MSQDILMEVNFFLNSLLIGVVITFVYDWLLILRKCIRHNIGIISLEDIIFWAACALGVFFMLHRENNGILRWFAVLAAAIGMWAYKKAISPIFVSVMSNIIVKTVSFLVKPILFICRQILRIIRKIILFIRLKCFILLKKLKKVLKIIIKMLTLRLRVIKIYLCKQESLLKERYGEKSRNP